MKLRLRGITRNVLALGWVSFFTDLASEMLYPLIPLFVVGPLGASPALLGLIEGIAEGISSGLRWIGGAMSDRFRRRKPFVFIGYAVSAFSKPLMGLAAIVGGWPLFLAGRAADRLGKSVRTAARDALIADSTEPQYRGIAFGFHRAMDTCGAILGPLAALAILHFAPGVPLQWVFVIAVLPGLVSALLVLTAVRDIPHPIGSAHLKSPALLQHFPAPFWLLLAANAVFSLGNSSDSFLILRSKELGLSTSQVILAFALYNTIYAIVATPLGHLSDRIGRKPVMIGGWLVYAGVYAGFAFVHAPLGPWILLGIYGLFQAMTEGISKAMVSDVVSPQQRAGAIGLYHTASGLGQLAASLIAGFTWNLRFFDGTAMAPFIIGAAFALLAIPLIASVGTRAAAPQPVAVES